MIFIYWRPSNRRVNWIETAVNVICARCRYDARVAAGEAGPRAAVFTILLRDHHTYLCVFWFLYHKR